MTSMGLFTESRGTPSFREIKESLGTIHWDRKSKLLAGCGGLCGVCAIFMFVMSFAAFFIIGAAIHEGIRANAVVDSADSPGYSMFMSNIDNEAPPEYECYAFFNLTNADILSQNDNVANVTTPIYDELGPYCYRLYHEKQNVQWSDDGNEVSYQVYTYYVWAPEMSEGNDNQDIVVNISPGYLGILATAMTETLMQFSFVGPVFYYNIQWLSTVFVHNVQVSYQAQYLLSQQQAILSTNTTSSDDFYAIWANSTGTPPPGFEGLLVSFQGTPSGLTLEQSENLWNSAIVNSLTYHKSGELWTNATVNPKTAELQATQAAALQTIQTSFNITETQSTMLATWLRDSFIPTIIDPMLLSKFSAIDPGVVELSDLGWLQWGTCYVTNKTAARAFNFPPGGVPEYGCYITTSKDSLFSVAKSKQLLNGTMGLFQMQNIAVFFEDYLLSLDPALCQTNTTSLFNKNCTSCSTCTLAYICTPTNSSYTCSLNRKNECVNGDGKTDGCTTSTYPDGTLFDCDSCRHCNQTTDQGNSTICSDCNSCQAESGASVGSCSDCEECEFFLNCYDEAQWDKIESIWGLTYESTLDFLIYYLYSEVTWANDYVQKVIFEGGGGLFPRRSLDDWIFHSKDTFVAIANPQEPGIANLVHNMTDPSDANWYPPSTVYTGKNDISQVQQYISFGNLTSIPWAEDVPVAGCNEWGQFSPFLNDSVHILETFDPIYLRTLRLERTGSVKYRGVELWRYMLSNNTLQPDPLYFQSIAGFANLTKFHRGCPLFYSFPHWAGVDEYWTSKVVGCAENQNYLTDYTVVDVEPTTGLVMHVNESLQVNLYLPKDYRGFTKFYNPPLDVMYPLMYGWKQSTLSEDNKKLYEVGVQGSQWLQVFMFGALFSGSFVLFALALAMFIALLRRSSAVAPGYTFVDNFSDDDDDYSSLVN